MIPRLVLAAMMHTGIGCATRGAAPTSPPVPGAALADAPPCAITDSFARRTRSFASLVRTTDELAFVSTASGLTLVHTDIVGEWTQIEFTGTRTIALRRGGTRIVRTFPGSGVDLDLGARWVYAATIRGADGHDDIVLGDLHDPAALRRIDPHPDPDESPRLVEGHDAGSALVWIRRSAEYAKKLRFALVGADHRIHVLRDIPGERSPIDAHLLRTPGGFALLYTEYSPDPRSPRAAPQLVLSLLGRTGELVRRQVLFAGELGGANAIVNANGIDVVFTAGLRQRALYLRTDLDGAVVIPARPIYTDPHSIAYIDPAALAYHRGLLWAALQVDYVGEHRQVARPRALLVAVAPDGRAAAPIPLSRSLDRGDRLALGVAENALLVAWSTGPWFSRTRLGRLHAAELRCSAHENG